MNNTRAAEAIIQALWPGPGPLILLLTLFSGVSAARPALFTYASRSPMRCSIVGSFGAAAAGAAAAGAAGASAANTANGRPQTTNRINVRIRFFIVWACNG